MQETEENENEYFRYGIAAMQGWRVTMVGFLTVLALLHQNVQVLNCSLGA
jgi:hypothetical protein